MYEENNVSRFGYEDAKNDLKLEIFGLKFNLDISDEYLKKLKELKKIAQNYEEDDEMVKICIDKLLGEGAYEKLNEKHKKDLGSEIDKLTWIKIALFIKDEFEKKVEKMKNENQFTNYNRQSRRNNKYNRRQNYRYRRY